MSRFILDDLEERIHGIGRLYYRMPCRFQCGLKECTDGLFVIDNQNGRYGSPACDHLGHLAIPPVATLQSVGYLPIRHPCWRQKNEEEMMDAPVDHRKHPRFPVYFKSIFSTDGVRLEDGVVLDLSLGGCRLMSEIHIPSGISLEIHIRPDQHSAIYVPRAVVRWVGATAFGVQFNQVPELELATLTRLLWTLRA